MKSNVLLVHNYYQLSGGEGTVAEHEMRALQAQGHEVTPYFRDNRALAQASLWRKLLLPFTSLFSFRTYREVRKLIREKGITVVHVHNTVPLISPSVYYAAWSRHVPVVQTVHNFRLLCPNGLFCREGEICERCVEKGLFQSVKYGCYRHSRAQSAVLAATLALHRLLGTYRRIETYLCLTEFNKEKLSRLVPADHITVKPNVIPPALRMVPYEERREQFCFAARLDREKGVWVLLDAFRRLPEKKLVIAGDGPERVAMEAYIVRHGMENVTMLGQVENAAARELIGGSLAAVMPSQWYEGFPIALLECYGAGTPVIGTDIGNVAEAIRLYGGGVTFPHQDGAALAETIRGLTREALRAMHLAALDTAAKWPTEAENAAALERIYQEAAGRRA